MNTQINLTVGQTEMININLGKKVKVNLLSDVKELYIHGACQMNGEFRYIMHSAKNPRTEFNDENGIHYNIQKGYYFVDPMRIIF